MLHLKGIAVTLRILDAPNADPQIFGEMGIEIHLMSISNVTGVRSVDTGSVIAYLFMEIDKAQIVLSKVPCLALQRRMRRCQP